MKEEKKKAVDKAIYELEDSYELHQREWAKKCLNTIKHGFTKLQKENEELKSENRRLKVIRYNTEYGTESIHLITKNDLVEINTNKYMIEIENGKFVDLKQVYQENKKYKQFFDLMLRLDSEYFMNCDDEVTKKIS